MIDGNKPQPGGVDAKATWNVFLLVVHALCAAGCTLLHVNLGPRYPLAIVGLLALLSPLPFALARGEGVDTGAGVQALMWLYAPMLVLMAFHRVRAVINRARGVRVHSRYGGDPLIGFLPVVGSLPEWTLRPLEIGLLGVAGYLLPPEYAPLANYLWAVAASFAVSLWLEGAGYRVMDDAANDMGVEAEYLTQRQNRF